MQLFVLDMYAQDKPVYPVTGRIMEEGFIRINGIYPWITIKGDSTKPVILFLHGGQFNR
jgi:hypothetical protein